MEPKEHYCSNCGEQLFTEPEQFWGLCWNCIDEDYEGLDEDDPVDIVIDDEGYTW